MRFALSFAVLALGACAASLWLGHANDASRFFNLGNAHVVEGRIPEAIFAYRRGLQLDPNDRELRDNLEYVRARVSYPLDGRGRPAPDMWPEWLPRPTDDWAAGVTLVLYTTACACFTRWLMVRARLYLAWAIVALVLALAGAWLALLLDSEVAWQARHPFVVVREDGTSFRKGNGLSYPPNPDLPRVQAGMEAWLKERRGGWLQLEFDGAEIGWVHEAAVLVDGG